MGSWSFYFLAKLGLFASGVIQFDWIANLIFALVLGIRFRNPNWRSLRTWIAVPIAVALFWHDSYWPDFRRLANEWPTLLQFSTAYWLELLARMLSLQIVGGLLIGAAAWYLINKKFRLGSLAIVAILLVPLLNLRNTGAAGAGSATAPAASQGVTSQAAKARPASEEKARNPLSATELTHFLQRFYADQQSVVVALDAGRKQPPFDLVFLSVCSLGWEDLKSGGLEQSPFLQRFDLVFRHFNTAASYSGPAVLRLLQATCGQSTQAALYQSAPEACYLFSQLQKLGYSTEVRLNHDGTLAGFSRQLQEFGRAGAVRIPSVAAAVAMDGVDGTPVRSDIEILKGWLDESSKGAQPRALVYNTVSLHDGNHVPGVGALVTPSSYKTVLNKLLQDLSDFTRLVEASGRPTVLVLIPEHGSALQADERQVSGLREFPTPTITDVPAGVALLGFGVERPKSGPVVVEQVASYAGLMGAIATLLAHPMPQAHAALKTYGQVLPPMPWVAENDSTVMIRDRQRLYLRTSRADWTEYPGRP